MSARILYNLSDQNPDLHNKTGRMNESKGNLLLRDVSIVSSSHHTKLPSGQRQTSTSGTEPIRAMHEIMGKPVSKANQTTPSGPSRSSVSSSWSPTSFSSADTYRRSSRPELTFYENRMSQETRQWCRTFHGVRDVVKDSIYREAQKLMTRNTRDEEKMLSTLEYIDSPRPFIQAKLTKNRDSHHDGSSQTILLKGTPRFSYDKREMGPSSTMRMQDMPRLSLDGKEQSIRSCVRQNYRLEDPHNQGRNSGFLNWQRDPESRGRKSGVVAKLMGLEVLPEPDPTLRFSRTKQNKHNLYTSSLKHANTEAAKPGVNIADHKKASGSTSKSTLNSVKIFHKKQTSCPAGSKKVIEKQTAEARASSPSLHRGGSSTQPLHNLKISSLKPLHMERAPRGQHLSIAESGERRRNHGLQQVRHQGKGQKEPGSPTRKARPRLQIPKQPESRKVQIDQSHKHYATSQKSESKTSMLPITSADVATNYKHEKAGVTVEQNTPKQKNTNPSDGEEVARQDLCAIGQEQPSPVSVLNAILSEDEPLSPVRKIANAFKDEEHSNSEETSQTSMHQSDLSNSRGSSLSSENDPNLLLANSMPEGFVIQETAVNESKHKERKYISEILSKSGILHDPESKLKVTQLRPTRLPLGPDVFLALEQGKESMEVPKDGMRYSSSCQLKVSEKIKRKLIFDTVNEILVQKIVFERVFKDCIPRRVLTGKGEKGHMILQTVFSTIDRLQAHISNSKLNDKDCNLNSILWEDLMQQEQQWRDFKGEIPGIVLDIERLIFKDLIVEIISGDREANKARTQKHSQKSFFYLVS